MILFIVRGTELKSYKLKSLKEEGVGRYMFYVIRIT
jgi:hypothetical protein